jgi:hypothetical protein
MGHFLRMHYHKWAARQTGSPIQGLSKPGSWGIMTGMANKNKEQTA